LQGRAFTEIHLDHDLVDEQVYDWMEFDERSGYMIAKWIAEHPEASPEAKIIIHSLNELGAERMNQVLRLAGRKQLVIPFVFLLDDSAEEAS